MFDANAIARKVVSGNVLDSFSKTPKPTVFETVKKLQLNEPLMVEPVIPEEISKSIDFEKIGMVDAVKGEVSSDAVANYYENRYKWLSYKELMARKAARLHMHSDASLVSIINGEMGTGKTLMGIATAYLLHELGHPRTLVIAPPHLVYKWRREIMQTVPNAVVWILNGPDTLRKLLLLRGMRAKPTQPTFFILGRVRMRMGFNWKPSFVGRSVHCVDQGEFKLRKVAACSHCFTPVKDEENTPLAYHRAHDYLNRSRMACEHCGDPLWSLVRDTPNPKSKRELVMDALRQIPTIGPKTADNLVRHFGEDMLAGMLEDNIFNFINLCDDDGDMVFSDRQAQRIERYLGNNEVSFGQGGYQPSEFIKRYLPKDYFGCLLVDEGHEYKNLGSAQGQAMGVLASCVKKAILLTGTLMGGYADDLFYLLYRLNPALMIQDGYTYNERGSIGPAAEAFMREHGVMIDTYKEASQTSHRTAKGNQYTKHTTKGPGFGPKGIMRYVVPITAFLKLRDIGGNVLPPYSEHFIEVPMDAEQRQHYSYMQSILVEELTKALRGGDHSLLGVVLNVLLAWPDCAFRAETVVHPHKKKVLVSAPVVYTESDLMPKERKLIELCRSEKRQGRKCLVYTTFTGTRDTTTRLKAKLEAEGFKVAVLKASVDAAKREDWLQDQVERGVDVIITNPELVKTGLDMLEFPTIVFMQTGYNVYTLQQAARRSWRIGQKVEVKIYFLGYKDSAQADCLTLMAKKITVSQSTSGDMPESGLDVLNQDGDSIEVALAKQLVAT
jgi:SNF2 family DNA or RNA helicase